MNLTLQDRLVKELRLAGINDIEAANDFLLAFVETFNRKFGKAPLVETDMHRPLTEMDDLEEILCHQDQRTIINSLTVQYDKVIYLLEDNRFTRTLRRKKATIFDYPDSTIAIKFEGRQLPYSTFEKIRHVKQADIVDNKRLSAALAFVQEKQKDMNNERSKKAPARRGQRRIHEQQHKSVKPAMTD